MLTRLYLLIWTEISMFNADQKTLLHKMPIPMELNGTYQL